MKRTIATLGAMSWILVGCAASPQLKLEAQSILRGQCLDMFLNANPGQYMYVANSPTGSGAFALASDGGGQACGVATNMNWDTAENNWFSKPGVDKMEAVAIARCEANKPASVKAPCRTFAKKNKIVWQNSLENGLQ